MNIESECILTSAMAPLNKSLGHHQTFLSATSLSPLTVTEKISPLNMLPHTL